MSRHPLRFLASICALGLVLTAVAADMIAERWQKRLDVVEANFRAAVQKADNGRNYAIQKANLDRLKFLKTILADANKASDFDAINAIKEQVTAAEQTAAERTKPKNVVKFGGHEYALINEPMTWHGAKRRCEQMGGYLMTVNSTKELELIPSLTKHHAWVGATDYEEEGNWMWVDGEPLTLDGVQLSNTEQQEHALMWGADLAALNDYPEGKRLPFLCEWSD